MSKDHAIDGNSPGRTVLWTVLQNSDNPLMRAESAQASALASEFELQIL